MTYTIQEAIKYLTGRHNSAVFEIRIPKAGGKNQTVSGYFSPDQAGAAERAVKKYDDGITNIYITMNPVDSALSARAYNRLKEYAKETATDKDIQRRVFILIDVDPRRPAGVSSTDEEKEKARKVIEAIREYLHEQRWPEPLYADSGNGFHLLYMIDLPNDPASNDLVKSCLLALDAKFSTDKVGVDKTVFNAARISKLYGTMACKGDSTCDRPHRRSHIIEIPNKAEVVSEELLKELAATAPVEQASRSVMKPESTEVKFDVPGFLDKHNIAVKQVKETSTGTMHILESCFFNPEHKGKDAAIIVLNNGAIDYKCFHDSCQGHTWQEMRESLDPGCYSRQLRGYNIDGEPVERKGYDNNDKGNAERFIDLFGENLRYAKALGWLVYNGRHWEIDDQNKAQQYALKIPDILFREYMNMGDSDEKKKEALKRHCLNSGQKQRIMGMITLAESNPAVVIKAEELNQDRWLLNCKNGTVDLRTGKLRPHQREDLITKMVNVNYDPDAKCPVWETFLDRVMESEKPGWNRQRIIDFLRRAAGYSLTGDVSEEVFFFLYGGGQNGKSTFINTLFRLLGKDDYARQINTRALINDGTDTSREKAQLFGARFVQTTELKAGTLDEETIKCLTGNDPITGEKKYHDPFTFYPEFKIWVSSNQKPRIKNVDLAIRRRVLMVPFTVTIPPEEKDEQLKDVKLPAEFPGILAWAVRGCLEWQKQGLKPPPEVMQATEEYLNDQDIFGKFFADNYIMASKRDFVTAKEVLDCHKRWAESEGEKALYSSILAEKLHSIGARKDKLKGERIWRGITAVKDTEDNKDRLDRLDRGGKMSEESKSYRESFAWSVQSAGSVHTDPYSADGYEEGEV